MRGKKIIKKRCAKKYGFYKDARILSAFLPITLRKISLLRRVLCVGMAVFSSAPWGGSVSMKRILRPIAAENCAVEIK